MNSQPPKLSTGARIVVIGGGIVGITSALELLRHGFEVTVLEPGEVGGEQSCSFGNSGWISPALVIPFSVPGLWKTVPGLLLNSRGPLTIKWSYLPHLAPWLLRYVHAGSTMERVVSTARALRTLLHDCHERHSKLAEEAGVGHLIVKGGQIQAYVNRGDFEGEAPFWRIRQEMGARWTELDAEQLHLMEPELGAHYRFGVWVDGYCCVDPGEYVSALARLVADRGAKFARGRAIGFEVANDRLHAVNTESGMMICDAAVIAAGAWSKSLVQQLKDSDIPLECERGYHVRIPGAQGRPSNRLLLMDARISANPSPDGIRVTGQNELAGLAAPPDWERARVLLDIAFEAFPKLSSGLSRQNIKRWMGYRPSLPDGRPVIGSSRKCPNVVYAFGRGHIGVASSPNTARMVGEIFLGRESADEVAAFSPYRF